MGDSRKRLGISLAWGTQIERGFFLANLLNGNEERADALPSVDASSMREGKTLIQVAIDS